MLVAYAVVEHALVERAPALRDDVLPSPGALGKEVLRRHVISPATADAIEGLTVMHNLAVQGWTAHGEES